MIALAGSRGLRAHLPDYTEFGDLISQHDTVQNEFPFDFPRDAATVEPLPVTVYLAVNAPGFDIPEPCKALHLAPRVESGVVTFFLTPTHRQERARVVVELYKDAARTILLSSLTLLTTVKGAQDELAQTLWRWVARPLNRRVISNSQDTLPQQPPLPDRWSSATSDHRESTLVQQADVTDRVKEGDRPMVPGADLMDSALPPPMPEPEPSEAEPPSPQPASPVIDALTEIDFDIDELINLLNDRPLLKDENLRSLTLQQPSFSPSQASFDFDLVTPIPYDAGDALDALQLPFLKPSLEVLCLLFLLLGPPPESSDSPFSLNPALLLRFLILLQSPEPT